MHEHRLVTQLAAAHRVREQSWSRCGYVKSDPVGESDPRGLACNPDNGEGWLHRYTSRYPVVT
jgi:hypothetical protein